MKRSIIGILIIGWLESLSIFILPITVINRNYYPLVLTLFPIPVSILGILTLKLKPISQRLNILFSPLIVLTYFSYLVIILEKIGLYLSFELKFNEFYFSFFYIFFLLFHIIFFTREKIKNEFRK